MSFDIHGSTYLYFYVYFYLYLYLCLISDLSPPSPSSLDIASTAPQPPLPPPFNGSTDISTAHYTPTGMRHTKCVSNGSHLIGSQ